VGIFTGIALATLASTPIGIAMVVIGASFGGSIVYDYTISDAVKSTLWLFLPMQKKQCLPPI
jgi:hypothetical protein